MDEDGNHNGGGRQEEYQKRAVERPPLSTTRLVSTLFATLSVGDWTEDPEPDAHRWAAEGRWDFQFRSPNIKLCMLTDGRPNPTNERRVRH